MLRTVLALTTLLAVSQARALDASGAPLDQAPKPKPKSATMVDLGLYAGCLNGQPANGPPDDPKGFIAAYKRCVPPVAD